MNPGSIPPSVYTPYSTSEYFDVLGSEPSSVNQSFQSQYLSQAQKNADTLNQMNDKNRIRLHIFINQQLQENRCKSVKDLSPDVCREILDKLHDHLDHGESERLTSAGLGKVSWFKWDRDLHGKAILTVIDEWYF